MRLSLLALLAVLTPASVLAQEMPTTQAGFYQAGQTFAHCSAHFRFAAEVARGNSLADNATAFEGMERGWRLAGLPLLTEGLDPSRQIQVQQVFADLQANKIDQFRAWRELEPQTYSQRMLREYEAACGPWAELQKSIIAAMRSGSSPR